MSIGKRFVDVWWGGWMGMGRRGVGVDVWGS